MKELNIITLMALEYCLSQNNPTGMSVFSSYIIESNIDEELKNSIINRLKRIKTKENDSKQYTYQIAQSLLTLLNKNDMSTM